MAVTAPTLADVRYGIHRQMELDVFRNATTLADGNPCIVFLHAGGWEGGTRKELNSGSFGFFTYAFDEFTTYGLAVPVNFVSASYRMTDYDPTRFPKSLPSYWPTPWEDCARAIQWVRDHASDYGINPQKIAVFGSSAGGAIGLWLAANPSFPYVPPGVSTGKFSYHSSSRVPIVVNYDGVVNVTPTHEGSPQWDWDVPVPGAGVRWHHAPYGNMAIGSPVGDPALTWEGIPTQLQKAVGSLDQIQQNAPRFGGIKVYSVYDGATSTASPPWESVHDSGQAAYLHARLEALGLTDHAYQVVAPGDWAGVQGSTGPGFDPTSEAISSALYAWLLDRWGL